MKNKHGYAGLPSILLNIDYMKHNSQLTTVGLLAFQGDVEEHESAILSLGYKTKWIRTKEELKDVTHLIIPGGESTTVGKFLYKTGVGEEIQKRVKNNTLQVYGTCAGAILLSKEVETKISVNNLKLIDIKISRNAYGAQIHSFSTKLEFIPQKKMFEAVFIRAPRIISYGKSVKVLCKYKDEAVAVEQGNVLVSTFHPELIRPAFIHEYFLNKSVKK